MKKLSFLIVLTVTTSVLFAQNTFPATGNVGIGTSTPAYNLDVSSGVNTTLRIQSTVNTGYSDLIFKGSLNSWKISKFPSGTSGPSVTGILAFTCNTGVYGGDRPVMELRLNGGYSPQVVIGSANTSLFGGATLGVNGRIGATKVVISNNTGYSLGISEANYALVADGKIGAREVVVTLASPFPDYVFKPEYKLLSLSEVEQHIKQYSRLPEMPSAAQVENEGLEVAKTTTLLVQKIEELTLHMIEMSKKIEKLEKDNNELRKAMSDDQLMK